MLVRALMRGYYGDRLREKGSVFELVERKDSKGKKIKPSDQFSARWMEEVKKGSRAYEKFFGEAEVEEVEDEAEIK